MQPSTLPLADVMTTTTSIISLIKDFALSIGAGIAAYVGIKGLTTWKRQIKGNIEFEAARRCLRTAFQLRDTLVSARNSFISSGEMAAALEAAGYKKEEYFAKFTNSAASTAAVYQARWKPVGEALSEHRLAMLEAEVIWGNEPLKASEDLQKCARKLFLGFQRHVRMLDSGDRKHSERETEVEKIVWSDVDPDGDDQLGEAIAAAVKSLEDKMRPHLKA